MVSDRLKDVIKSAGKKYDLEMSPLGALAEEIQAYPTGNIAIDHLTGVGGLPVGRSIELYGLSSSGKTTLAIQTCAAVQKIIKAGGNADPTRGPIIGPDDAICYFDYEHAMDLSYVSALGLDVQHDSFLFYQPETLEQGANLAKAIIETGDVRVMVWDSIPAALPSSKAEAEIGKSLPAIAAKLYADFVSSLNEPLHRNNCTAIYINHLAEVMSMGMQRPGMPPLTTTPGGRALKFYASVRVEFKQFGNIKEKFIDPLTNEEIEQHTATNVRVKITKNKVGPPNRTALVRVRWGKGFDDFWSAMQILIAHKKIVYSAGYYYWERSPQLIHVNMARQTTGTKRPYIRGEKTLFDFADAEPGWRALVIAAAVAALAAEPDLAPDLIGSVEQLVEAPTGHSDAEQVDPATGEIITVEDLVALDEVAGFIPKPTETVSLGVAINMSDILRDSSLEKEQEKEEEEPVTDPNESLLADLGYLIKSSS